ncbi:MAG: patatin-like phospholipase family protein [Chloroflexi bacterium]|nr:patatin-like phospholipase family protein [Chloroflexota bacterium]
MIAFVMSGGGNRGALEAGALQELFEEGIKPDILVGTSAGALNASFIATDPTLQGARRLADTWTHAQKDDFFPGNWFSMLGRLASGKSLFPSDALRAFAQKMIPPEKSHFGDLQGVKLYLTASNLNTGRLYLYGEQPDASIIDAAITSAAHPLAFPPVMYQGSQLVDGGVVANVPIGIAIDKGATEVYILNVGYNGETVSDQNNIIEILNRVISMMMFQHLLMDLRYATKQPNVSLNYIPMNQFASTQLWDLSKGAEMVEAGRRAARDYLNDPTGTGGISFGLPDQSEGEPPPGAVPYIPPWLR